MKHIFLFLSIIFLLYGHVLSQSRILKIIDSCYSCGESNPFAADLNNDGRDEIITRADNGDLSIFSFNAQDQEFSAHSLSGAPPHIQIADWDSDGDQDMVSIYGWLENTGSLDAFTVHMFEMNSLIFAYRVFVSDFNGDGRPDLGLIQSQYVSYNREDNISWLENTGTATPLYHEISVVGDNSPLVLTADFDNDGDSDLIVLPQVSTFTTPYPVMHYFKNTDGNGNFSAAITYPGSAFLQEANISDCDGDGDKDIVLLLGDGFDYSLGFSTGLVWVENTDGAGNFNMQHIIDTTSFFIGSTVCDIDADGDEDIVSDRYDGPFSSGLIALLNDGEGNYDMEFMLDTLKSSNTIIANINNDDLPDIIYRSGTQMIALTQDSVAMQFHEPKQVRFLNGAVRAASIADVDGDSAQDLMVTDMYGGIFLYEMNESTENFERVKRISSAAEFENSLVDKANLFILDFDNDGDNDCMVMRADRYLPDSVVNAYYENTDGSGNFIMRFNPQYTVFEDNVFSDIDGDGDPDYFFISDSDDIVQISWIRNDISGGGSFTKITLLEPEALQHYFAADYDDDGDTDLLFADRHSYGINVLQNDGEGNFNLIADFWGDDLCYKFFLFDNDNDGDKDMFYRNGDLKNGYNEDDGEYDYISSLQSFLVTGNGDGDYENKVSFDTSPFTGAELPRQMDINGDGYADLVTYQDCYAPWNEWLPATVIYYMDAATGFLNSTPDIYGWGGFTCFTDITGDTKPEFIGFNDKEFFWKNYSDSIPPFNENDATDEDTISLYPNPIRDNSFTLTPEPYDYIYDVSILTITGQSVPFTYYYIGELSIKIVVGDIAKGIYIVHMNSSEGVTMAKKFIKL